jgi:hypothetical protein
MRIRSCNDCFQIKVCLIFWMVFVLYTKCHILCLLSHILTICSSSSVYFIAEM